MLDPIELHAQSVPAPVVSRHAIRVLRTEDIAREDRGWTRGHATHDFDDVPTDAPGRLAWGPIKLAVLQEVDAGAGYAMHPHHNVETITLILSGALLHEDSLGGRDRAGESELTVLSAGSGISHSEFADTAGPVRAVMFWVEPDVFETAPQYAKRHFPRSERINTFRVLACGPHREEPGALRVRGDVVFAAAALEMEGTARYPLEVGRRCYLLSTDAPVWVNGVRVDAGDRVLATGPAELTVRGTEPTDVVLVDV